MAGPQLGESRVEVGVPHLGVRPGSPGRAGWIRRQRHAPSGSHLAGERAEHGAGGWAVGPWAPHHGGSTKVPLPTAQSASGAGPSLALGHQTHSTGDASSEPMEGEGSGTRHPWSLGKGSRHSGRPDTGVSSPLVPKSRLPFNITSVGGGQPWLVSTLHTVAI